MITCPCCQGKLTVDPELEAVIAHEAPPPTRAAKDLGAAFDTLRTNFDKMRKAFEKDGYQSPSYNRAQMAISAGVSTRRA